MTFFVRFSLLLGFIISYSILLYVSGSILYVSGKKRSRSDESEEEVEDSRNKKEELEK